MDFTLVAYYGEKPPQIARLVQEVNRELRASLGGAFHPYSLQQVHATIIGLEGYRSGARIINSNYLRKCGELRALDLERVFQILEDESLLPFNITIGGFTEHGRYPFMSRSSPPHLRSFSVQGSCAVVVGWPYQNGEHSESMDKIRRAFNQANALHKYHDSPTAEDNDFFLVLGSLDRMQVNAIRLQETIGRLQSFLIARQPTIVRVCRECLRLVAYVDPKLPRETSASYTIDEAQGKIDEIRSLYRELD